MSVSTSQKTQLFYITEIDVKGNNSSLFGECKENDEHSVCKVKVGIVNVE
jgi:hypothetical protein